MNGIKKIIAKSLNTKQISIREFEKSTLFKEFKKQYPSFRVEINDILEQKTNIITYTI